MAMAGGGSPPGSHAYDPFPWLRRELPFSHEELFRHPDFLPDGSLAPNGLESINGRSPKEVLVVGGGIAGLTAAYELNRLGHKVWLVEASDRWGGRILTKHFPTPDDPYYGEFGAMRIPRIHATVLHYVLRTFRLPPRRFIQVNERGWYFIRNELRRVGDWEGLHPRFTLRDSVKKVPPANALDTILSYPFNARDQDRWQVFGTGLLTDPVLKRCASTTLLQYIRSPELFQFPSTPGTGAVAAPAIDLSPPAWTDEEWDYIGKTTGAFWDEKASLLEAMVDNIAFSEPNMYEIVGGMERLVEAFVDHLDGRCPCLRRARLTKLEVTRQGVTATCEFPHGKESRLFDYVVSTLPAAAVNQVEFDRHLPSAKQSALGNLQYQSAAKALVYCRERFWEFDKDSGGIYGGASYTDQTSHQVWYPSDNAVLVDEPLVPYIAGSASTPGEARGPGRSLYTRAFLPSLSRTPGVLIGGYMWGTNARRFASMPDGDKEATIRGTLERIHPGIDKYVEKVRWHVWDEQSNPGGGAWAYFGEGDHERYQAALIEPVRDDDGLGRVFFAGEHLAVAHAWIQSSMQTALGAVWHVCSSP